MVQKLKNIVFFLLFIGSLLVGISIGRLMSDGQTDYAAFPTQTTGDPPNSTHAVLIAGVDSISAPTAVLHSAWLVFFEPGSPNFDILPLYPVTNSPTLYSYMSPHTPILIDPKDMSALTNLEIFKLQDALWNDVILIDQFGLDQIVFLTARENNTPSDGASFAASLSEPWVDPPTSLRQQTNVFKFLCDQTETFAQWENAETLIGLLGEHILSTFDQRALMIQWQWLSNQSFEIECRFPSVP